MSIPSTANTSRASPIRIPRFCIRPTRVVSNCNILKPAQSEQPIGFVAGKPQQSYSGHACAEKSQPMGARLGQVYPAVQSRRGTIRFLNSSDIRQRLSSSRSASFGRSACSRSRWSSSIRARIAAKSSAARGRTTVPSQFRHSWSLRLIFDAMRRDPTVN